MNQRLQQLSYEWPANLHKYETNLFLGLSAVEAIVAVFALITPLVVLDNVFVGVLLGALLAALALLTIKKIERLGNVPLPIFLGKRLLAHYQPQALKLPLIMGAENGTIHVETMEGETLLTME